MSNLRRFSVAAHKLFHRNKLSSGISTGRCKLSNNDPLAEALSHDPGTHLHGYTVQSVTEVPDFNLVAVQLRHDVTGARHIHMARKDSNNTFGVGLKTVPMDSTGVAHILEHTTLCGSQRYPVRDPFFKMLSRSLQTFMNAYTSTDWTMYPFATQNPKDYRNLLSVYLDCVFRPMLKESDFNQEGWRLEHQCVDDVTTPLEFKGVVYNEMKGVFATSESLFMMELQRKLLPSHTYSHYYGGIPNNILDLTWEQLKNFHSQCYHPSNSRFYTYGNFPLASHLEYINNAVLSGFTNSNVSLDIPNETRWTEPREHLLYCAPDPMAADPNKQATVGVAYMLGSVTDPYECFIQSLLSKLLIDGPASPFYQSLIDSNIGAEYSPGTGYNNYTKDSCFSVGLQKVSPEDVDKVKDIIRSTFEKVESEGFSETRVKAVLHQIEMGLKHQSSNFGLSLMLVVLPPWFHEADPVSVLQVNRVVDQFKENLKNDPKYLQKKVREYFIDNKHALTLVMSPKDSYEAEVRESEELKLKRMVESLTDEDKERIYQQGLSLRAEQNEIQDASCLPTVTIFDVNKKAEPTPFDVDHSHGVPVQYCEQPTNGLTYFRGLSGCENLPQELQIYLPLFTEVITRMGTGTMSHRLFAEQCDLYTGGSLSVDTHVATHHTKRNNVEQAVSFSSHCLDRHLPYMFSLWTDVFTDPNMQDMDRLRTLVTMTASSLSMAVADHGHSYAITASASSLTPAAMLSETFNGMTQVKLMKEIAEMSDLSDVLRKLSSIAVHVMDSGCMRCAINTTSDSRSSVFHAMDAFVDAIPGGHTDTMDFMMEIDHTHATRHTHYNLPFPVYYVGQSYVTVPFTHEDAPCLLVLARLLSWKYLHKEIREKGGAYGGGARHGNGVLSFFSYRDPNSMDTISRFQDSIEWAVNGSFTKQDIDEAKLSVFSQVDSPVSPSGKGASLFYSGITDDMKQQQRERIFNVTKEHLVDVAKRYLNEANVKGSAIIGPDVDNLPSEWTVENFKL